LTFDLTFHFGSRSPAIRATHHLPRRRRTWICRCRLPVSSLDWTRPKCSLELSEYVTTELFPVMQKQHFLMQCLVSCG